MADNAEAARNQFAALIMTRLRARGQRDVSYDSDEFQITAGDLVINLGNIYRETRELSPAEADERVTRFLSAMSDPDPAPGWPEVRAYLRPLLRPATYGLGPSEPLSRPAFPFINELVAVDRPNSRSILLQTSIEDWGVTADEVFAAARENLAALVRPHEGSDGNSIVNYIDNGDGYFTSWLLEPGWLASFRARYGHRRPVAFIPENDRLIVVPDVPAILEKTYAMVEEEFQAAPRSLSPQGYTLAADDTVIPFDQAGPHEQLPAAHRARCGLAATEYARQTAWLSETYEEHFEIPAYDLEPAFVAKVSFLLTVDGPCTLTVWGEGVDYLLPEADYVAFLRNDESGEPERLFDVPFAAVAETLELTPIPGMNPPRYEIRSWPSAEQLTRLSQAAVTLQPAD
ncbi:hypothetical protein ACFVMC_11380 [Nocardia sp. NPDC127579]|uniref:hypothetical protein n=1 Tax=Nocardia sp. NPDC127579 TaxID=3345402 RepID=UPI0036400399